MIEDLYKSRGIFEPEDLMIDNVAESFNITLFKDYPRDVRISSDDIDIIMLQSNDIHRMTERFFHEFAHVLTHGHTHINESYRTYCENQANRLMYELAVPNFMITDHRVDYKYISNNFNVSEQFALKRIEQLRQQRLTKYIS